MSKQTEALKLALEGLEKWRFDKDPRGADEYITAIREALAEQPAQGCDYCNHPQYAGTKCKNCGREQPAQQDMPKIGCVNHDCDQCKAQQQEPVAVVDANDDGYWAEILPDRNVKVGQLLYTSPPASKPWVGLTPEDKLEIEKIVGITEDDDGWMVSQMFTLTETKLKEKNT